MRYLIIILCFLTIPLMAEEVDNSDPTYDVVGINAMCHGFGQEPWQWMIITDEHKVYEFDQYQEDGEWTPDVAYIIPGRCYSVWIVEDRIVKILPLDGVEECNPRFNDDTFEEIGAQELAPEFLVVQ